jgi:hypothetical protein
MTHKMVNGKSVPLTSADVAALAEREAAWLADEPRRRADRERFDVLSTDVPAKEMVNRLAATAGDLDSWFAVNVTNFEQANAVLKELCKIIMVRRRG